MANTYQETEIKLYVPDLAVVEQRLRSLGAVLKAPRIYERNNRYDDAEKTLMHGHQVLRLRWDSRARLTYKEENGGAVEGSRARSRFEAEVEVSDFDTMHTILLRLGFQPFMVYEKYRTTYTFNEAEVTLDEMPYGNFVEIEGSAAAIEAAVKALELTQAPAFAEGYALLFEHVRRHLRLTFTDLTFENFAGIEVPLSAFSP
ncbi:CYTH domain-containing protein [Anaerolineae bacterium CFX9]|nr:CYTH domain-containing protein [Anaerolineae bacterium CFX9]